MSRPAIFRIELGVRIPIVLGAISNLALAGFYRCLFVFLRNVLRYTLVERKIFVVKKKYCSLTMVKSAPLPTEDTSRR